MKRGGRPKHESYQELAFIFKKDNGKSVAECLGCHMILQNKIKERLKRHRKCCIIVEDENEETSTNSIMDVDRTQSTAAAMTFNSINFSNITDINSTSRDEVLLLNNNNLNLIRICTSCIFMEEVGEIKEDNANLVIVVPPDTNTAKTDKKTAFARSNSGKQRRIKPFMDYID